VIDRRQLADDLARLLADHPAGLSCDTIRLKLGRQRAAVLDVLRTDGRFLHDGQHRGSRWRLRAMVGPAPPDGQRGPQDGQGRLPGPIPDLAFALAVLDRLEALEQEVAELRQRLGEEASTT
jgi:hypothetical protein